MIQRRELLENPRLSLPSGMSTKFSIKERKAAKRKEKSRVAAQIRRNKESQTLILLQNALPLSLPTQSQMLEKSIVIRIAGQTLFLMNTLDQVLGIKGWLSIPLLSNNFLAFFVDSSGQIVFVSPNIQFILEHNHWSNVIGMSISDVITFKYRWPVLGEVVRLRLCSNPSIPSDSTQLLSSTNSQSTSLRNAIASRLNIKKNSQTWDYGLSTCSLFNVWGCSNINHTDAKLRLLILQTVHIKSSILNNLHTENDSSKHVGLSISLERSISWPLMSSPLIKEQPSKYAQNKFDKNDHIPTPFQCIYQHLITSSHDRHYNFKSASPEFCHLIGESPLSIVDLNLVDFVHLEDVINVKSVLDIFVTNSDSYVWTPLYRVMGTNGSQCVVKTLVKQCHTSSSRLILNHLIIKNSNICHHKEPCEQNRISSPHRSTISQKIENHKVQKTLKKEPFIIIGADYECRTNLKRKSSDRMKVSTGDKYARLSKRTFSSPGVLTNLYTDLDLSEPPPIKIQGISNCSKAKLKSDPFLPMDLERYSTFNKKSHKHIVDTTNNMTPNPYLQKGALRLRLDGPFNYPSIRSPSYSLESCVLTSPGSESTDVPFDEQFHWDMCDSFQEMTPLNYYLDEQYQNDLELILPI